MRLLRAISVLLLLVASLAFVVGEDVAARAQTVDEAERATDAARIQADAAAGILREAASTRAGIEDDLAASIVRLGEINAELSRVSVELDEIRTRLASSEGAIASIGEALSTQAVAAYIRAVTVPAASLMGTGNAETAIIAASSVDGAIQSDQGEVAELTIQRRELQRLTETYAADQARVADLQMEADAEASVFEDLLAEADTELAAAAAAGRAADQAFRAALGGVDSARAREAERDRERHRQSTTTTAVPATASSITATTSGEPTPSTPSTTPPGIDFPAAVERWRPIVATYFPAARVDEALYVIQCESNGDPAAYNPYSGAGGLFQFLPPTWAAVSISAGFAGADVSDGEANIGSAAWLSAYYESRGSSPWAAWTCRP